MIVLDASVAVKLVFAEVDREVALSEIENASEIIAPDLLVAEIANIAWKKLRAGHATSEQISQLSVIPTEVVTTLVKGACLIEEAIRLAGEFDHPAYDCFYLAAALRYDCAVVTADRKFAAVAERKHEKHIRLIGNLESQNG